MNQLFEAYFQLWLW